MVSAGFDLGWQPYSRLFVVDDTANWVLSWEAHELRLLAQKMGVRLGPNILAGLTNHQSIFYSDQYAVLKKENFSRDHHYGLAYFHGLPKNGIPDFDNFYSAFKGVAEKISRIQVANSEIYDFFMNEGWSTEKVHLIPIGINISFFESQTLEKKAAFRRKYDIPPGAVVLGSFQKDGEGWDDGNIPKLLKGPDIFLQVISILKPKIPDLYVLLSGPARGFVKIGLEKLGVQYKHVYLTEYPQVSELYQAIDAYVISSRIEGGPKAVLESMATGIPLVTTNVGQAADMVHHLENGWVVDVEDAEGLAEGVLWYLEHPTEVKTILKNARNTAEHNSYGQQSSAWARFFLNFVEID